MLAIEVRFLAGTIRLGSPDDLALTGQCDPGEWPPSPARLLAALTAADGTRGRCRVTDGSELRLLEAAPPPRIVADRRDAVLVNQLQPRYAVVDARVNGSVQEYPCRQSREVRPSPRLSPEHPAVHYVWDDADPSEGELRALRRRAARVGYLGCSDSPVHVSVHRREPHRTQGLSEWTPAERGEVALPVPYDGFIAALDEAFDHFTAGQFVRRSWIPTRRAWYTTGRAEQRENAPPSIVWLLFERPVSGRHVLLVSGALRNAVLELYERHVAGSRDGVPSVLHGHGFEGRGYEHARFLALPDVGHQYASGRLHGAAVWLPPGTGADIVQGVRTAVWHLRHLAVPGRRPVPVRVHDGRARPVAARPARWCGIGSEHLPARRRSQ